MLIAKARIPAAFLLVGLVGCVWTSLTTLKAPEIAATGYRRVMVAFPVTDLRRQMLVEDGFASAVKGRDTVFISSYKVLFPGQPITPEELGKAIIAHRLDAVLVVSVEQAGTTTVALPSTTSTECTAYGPAGCSSARAVTRGGGDLSKPWANFRAQLFDLKSQRVVWVASANSSGNAFADTDDILYSFATTTRSRLRKERIVP